MPAPAPDPTPSPFLAIPAEHHVAANPLAFAVRDKFPVSPGHTLVIPRRQIPDWWSATPEERQAILTLVDQVRTGLLNDATRARLLPGIPRPDGFNVGFNAGDAAGQTVNHLHMHVIPRYRGDMPDPRGGVRHVIPEKGNYLAPRDFTPRLHDAPARPLRAALLDALANPQINTAAFAASFVMSSGLRVLDQLLDVLLQRPGSSVRLLTTDYLGATEKSALITLLERQAEYGPRFTVRLFKAAGTSFHPKAYILTDSIESARGVMFVGSANASQYGLVDGHEWSLESQSPATITNALARFDELWNHERAVDLSTTVIDAYAEAPRGPRTDEAADDPVTTPPAPIRGDSPVEVEPPTQPIAPTELQRVALDALELTRAQGYRSGLVVMATGLGKTWLAAFDSARPEFRRVLFVAHREEILDQARAVFRQVRPDASVGRLGGGRSELDADIVMASVQTLHRQVHAIPIDAFDYVIVDEFHHASSLTYRKVISALDPRFLLGITATPQRTDRADLLALCEDNLVFDCALAEGIDRGMLSPFHYHGVPDPIDFKPLPWRSGKFDPTALENALIAANRTQAAFREWSARRGTRTLAFCASQRHADWMSDYFAQQGIRTASVHAGPTSAPREQTLADLRSGALEIVFCVDIFNEGTDIPDLDTVLMLRPTTSPILFVQQIGRGLRKAVGKTSLTVIDFVGTHRSLLLPVRVLAGLADPTISEARLREAIENGDIKLPEGCSVDYELEAKQTILSLLPGSLRVTSVDFAKTWAAERGDRPTAFETYAGGVSPSGSQPSWFEALGEEGLLTSAEQRVLERHRDLLVDVASTSMTKSYKMVTIRAMLLMGSLTSGADLTSLVATSHQLMLRDPRLRADVTAKAVGDMEAVSAATWQTYWTKFPLTHLQTGGQFRLRGNVFELVDPPAPEDAETLEAMMNELCEWRLASYLDRHSSARLLLKLSHTSGGPILRFDRTKQPRIPKGRGTPVQIGGEVLLLDFMKIAVNVARRDPDGPNVLAELMRDWFGPSAGLPGTTSYVELLQDGHAWVMVPYPRPELSTQERATR